MRGVRKNIRGRILLNPYKNYRMLSPKYSRSDRIGDLYDRYFYKEAWQGAAERRLRDLLLRRGRRMREPRPTARVGRRQIQLRWLKVKPLGWQGEKAFNPDTDNASLDAKVPMLVMNATSLNTGHNWRFEAVRMGEPEPEEPEAAVLLASIDVNERLSQAYFESRTLPSGESARLVPASQQDFPLAKAVAASAAVPLLFQPLPVSDMYSGRRVQLVDGGVHDNQGVQALLDMECDAIVISDASGLMEDVHRPWPYIFKVAPRSSSIYGARVRIEQIVRTETKTGVAAKLMHLLGDLLPAVVDPLPSRPAPPTGGPLTNYGINRRVQKALARVRTDLDAFTDVEAYSLMYSGYRMAVHQIDAWPKVRRLVGQPGALVDPGAWVFRDVAPFAEAQTPPPEYSRILDASRHRLFKFVHALPRGAGLAAAATLSSSAAGAVFGVVWGAAHSDFDLGPVTNWAWLGVIALVPALLSGAAVMQLVGSLLYLRLGRTSRLSRSPG